MTTGSARPMHSDMHKSSSLFDAIEDNDLSSVRAALIYTDINARHGPFGQTPLYAACASYDVSLDMLTLLLDAGADPRLGIGQTGVLHGLGFGNCNDLDPQALAGVIGRCISLGADIEERSENLQWTPLMTAINEWNATVVEALLIAGADPRASAGHDNTAITAGQTCQQMANNDRIAKLIENYSSNP